MPSKLVSRRPSAPRSAQNKPAPRTTFIALIDITKAYDTVWRELLWVEMANVMKIPLKLYSDSVNTVVLDGERSAPFPIIIGLRQGCVLSPTLWAIYINRIISEFPKTSGVSVSLTAPALGSLSACRVALLLFTDDTALIEGTAAALQKSLNKFNDLCSRRRVVINIDKSKVLAVDFKGNAKTDVVITIGSRRLEVVDNFKYLGAWFNSQGSRSTDLENKLESHNKACVSWARLLNHRWLSLLARTRIWTCLCRPLLEYAPEAIFINQTFATDLDRAQITVLRRILGAPPSTPSASFILAQTGLQSTWSQPVSPSPHPFLPQAHRQEEQRGPAS